ncbi:MAG: FKBP-type peptidyl-prolyl cis-trans isomerase [Muribaculaceae bacterium]|nr:FKBP-type peptidyl-prolyl cis-trans isomerase [Muribaculaceae bacterium]
MKKFPMILMLCFLVAGIMTSCLDSDNTGDIDKDYLEANTNFYKAQASLKNADGTDYYKVVTAAWDPTAQVLMHWFNDTAATAGNLKPLYTSIVDVKYKLTLYDGTAVDSSYTRTSPADSVFRTRINTGVIMGWPIALTRMHIGDSCRVVVPYSQGYGSTDYDLIKAGSTLVFDMKLVGIPAYETGKASSN